MQKATSRNLILVRERWSHMSSVSGFDPLFAEIQRTRPRRSRSLFIQPASHSHNPFIRVYRRMRDRTFEHMRRLAPFPSCSVDHEKTATLLRRHLESDGNALGILSVGESQLAGHLVQASEDVKKRIIICLHQPPSELRLHWNNIGILSGFAAVLCLGRNLAEYVMAEGKVPVWQLRHGVDLEFFRPRSTRDAASPPRLVFVGHWLRDFETLRRAFAFLRAERPDLRLDCIVPTDRRDRQSIARLARDPLVHWHANISSESLRELYNCADLMLLPLNDCVANNAIVEALACGLPVVTTNVGAAHEYVPEGCGTLCEAESGQDHAKATLQWLKRLKMGERSQSRAFAEANLDWTIIAKQFVDLMDNFDGLKAR
jgi:glycosyltransferase involved in cell wall biosynthesis